jgi:hypothetical protein
MSETAIDRARAANLLGVPPEASPSEARRAFLQRLGRIEFVPPAEWCAGLNGLDGSARAGGFRCALEVTAHSCDDTLRADLQAFISDFWQMSPGSRTDRWTALYDRSRNRPAIRIHVDQLAAGLEIESREFAELNGVSSLLAAIIRDTFPLSPLARAAERNARVATLEGFAGWRITVRAFRTSYPRLAALDADLLRRLEEISRADEQPAPARPYQPTTTGKNESKTWWPTYLIFFVAIGIFRAAFSSSSTSSSSRYESPPYGSYQPSPPTKYAGNHYPETNPLANEAGRLLVELDILVLEMQLNPNEIKYQKLKTWLQSTKADVLRLRGYIGKVENAQAIVRFYEQKREGNAFKEISP